MFRIGDQTPGVLPITSVTELIAQINHQLRIVRKKEQKRVTNVVGV